MNIIQWDIETDDGVFRIEKEFLTTSISLNDRLLLKKWSWFAMRRLYEVESEGAQYKVRFRWSLNVFRNLGLKCYVEKDGQLIADNPDRTKIYVRNYLILILIGAALSFAIFEYLIWVAPNPPAGG